MKYFILPSALIMQLCLGATYSWSVYVQDIRSLLGLTQAAAQVPFSVFYFVFPATMIAAGFVLNRIGPRLSAMIGGALFGCGWMVGSLGGAGFAYTIIGNGLIAGVGSGIAYIVPISTCIKWFPNNKGLVTGLAVAGFGGGAALVSKIGGAMLAAGATPFDVFRTLGVGFVLCTLCAGFFMVNPKGMRSAAQKKTDIKGVINDTAFQLLYFAMFTGLAAGFAVNANLKDLSAGLDTATGVKAVAFFAVANAAGRIAWGFFFDKMAAQKVIQANLVSQALLLFSSALFFKSPAGLLWFAIFAGFNYGGVLVVYAGAVANIWGADKVASVYGLLFSSNIPGAIAPLVAAYSYDRTGSFLPALAGFALLLLASTGMLQMKKRRIGN
jgi:OFA family oxalate/formate antiporter-like MFS transporter